MRCPRAVHQPTTNAPWTPHMRDTAPSMEKGGSNRIRKINIVNISLELAEGHFTAAVTLCGLVRVVA